jgi:hypothetical protein
MKTVTKFKISAAAALLLAAIFLPEVVSAGWHIAHGRTVDYRAWKVDVPFEWYAVSHGEVMSVERMTRLSWDKAPVAEFQPVHFTKTYPFKYEVYGKVQAETLQRRGYLFEAQRDVEIAGKPGMCWTFDNWKNHDQLWIACIVPKDLTSADYIGNKAYANEFFSFLAQTQRNPAAAN